MADAEKFSRLDRLLEARVYKSHRARLLHIVQCEVEKANRNNRDRSNAFASYPSRRLLAINGAIAKAKRNGCRNASTSWTIVESAHLSAYGRSTTLSVRSSLNKAISAAWLRRPTGRLDPQARVKLAVTTGGRLRLLHLLRPRGSVREFE